MDNAPEFVLDMHADNFIEGTLRAETEGEGARGIERIEALLLAANKVRRQSVPASHLTLALQCGGSDGYSGNSANPALGAAVYLLVRHGGTAILSETPEIYGDDEFAPWLVGATM